MRYVCSGRGVFWRVGDADPRRRPRKRKTTSEIIEGGRLVQTPKVFQIPPSPSNRIRPLEHTLVRTSHPFQLYHRRPGTRVVEERVKAEDASRDFWNGKTKFRVEAEDVADEFLSFRGDGPGLQQAIVIAHESNEFSAVECGAIPWPEAKHI